MVKKKWLWRNTTTGAWYVRLKGAYHRIRAAEGTPDFDREYWEILSGRRAEAKTSWNALIDSYMRSDRWTNLKPRTRGDYERVLRYLQEKIGSRDVGRLIRKDVIAAQDANRDRTRFANYVAQVMSVLCEHAIDIGWRADNPAKGVRALKTPEERRSPHVPWTDSAVALFRAEASAEARLIFELGVGSVQRPTDWTKFRWNDYDGDALRVVQGKTGKALHLPCTAQLKAALDAAPKKGLTILTMKDGRPLSYRRMAQIMRDERARLGLDAYDLHALRYRGVMELAWKGCTDDEIASYSGHASKAMIAKYAGEARQRTLAQQARAKRR